MSLDALKTAAKNAGNIAYNSGVTTIRSLQNVLQKTSKEVNELAKKITSLVRDFFRSYLPNYLSSVKEYAKIGYEFSKKYAVQGFNLAQKHASIAISHINKNKQSIGIGFGLGLVAAIAAYNISKIFQDDTDEI